MDLDAQRLELENQKAAIEQYLEHPVTRETLKDLKEGQDALVGILCDVPITDIESFFKHFEAVGHLRGLRRSEAMLHTNLEEIKQELKEIQ